MILQAERTFIAIKPDGVQRGLVSPLPMIYADAQLRIERLSQDLKISGRNELVRWTEMNHCDRKLVWLIAADEHEDSLL